MRRSADCVVLIAALVMLVPAIPPSSVILEITSSGADVFEPLMASTDMTNDSAVERFSVTVCAVPALAAFAYHIALRRSMLPDEWLVGPAAEIHVLLLLSVTDIVTF